jgi:glycosyltransferase involved in cell wall biosynthesis
MPKQILIATLLLPDGDTGVQSHFRSFLAWAEKKGVASSLLTPYNRPRWMVYPAFAVRRLIDPWHKPASVWWYRYWHALFVKQALRIALSDGRACTIYAQCPLSAAAALQARTSPSQRVVMVAHFNISQADEWVGKGMIFEGDASYRSIRDFEAAVLPRLDGLVFVSDFMRKELAARIPATTRVPYRIVPNFMADPGPVNEAESPDADLICIGTLEPRKNQRYALEIVAAAARMGRRLTLTIVGDGPDRTMLEATASELDITKQVTFLGFVKNAASLMPRHRAFVHVARIENLAIVLIEAMAHGLPVFAPAVGGIPEVFSNDIEGRFIPLDAPDAAAKIIVEWLDSQDRMSKAKAAARDLFVTYFSADKVAAELADFLDRQGKGELFFGKQTIRPTGL